MKTSAGWLAPLLVLASCGAPARPLEVEVGGSATPTDASPLAESSVRVAAPAEPADVALDPDANPFKGTPRSRNLLVTEIQNLESLLRASAQNDARKIVERLALTYGELERSAEIDLEGQQSDSPEAAKSQKVAEVARKQRLKYQKRRDDAP